jgi:carboxypeptidase family protein
VNALRSALVFVVTAWPSAADGLAAQGVTTAALFGAVAGSDSAGLEDAVVTVTNTATGERWQTPTGARGRYVFEYLSVGGPYVVEARAIGFAPARVPEILLSLGERRRSDFTLLPAVVKLQEIAVVAVTDPLVTPGRTGPAQTIGDSLIRGQGTDWEGFDRPPSRGLQHQGTGVYPRRADRTGSRRVLS